MLAIRVLASQNRQWPDWFFLWWGSDKIGWANQIQQPRVEIIELLQKMMERASERLEISLVSSEINCKKNSKSLVTKCDCLKTAPFVPAISQSSQAEFNIARRNLKEKRLVASLGHPKLTGNFRHRDGTYISWWLVCFFSNFLNFHQSFTVEAQERARYDCGECCECSGHQTLPHSSKPTRRRGWSNRLWWSWSPCRGSWHSFAWAHSPCINSTPSPQSVLFEHEACQEAHEQISGIWPPNSDQKTAGICSAMPGPSHCQWIWCGNPPGSLRCILEPSPQQEKEENSRDWKADGGRVSIHCCSECWWKNSVRIFPVHIMVAVIHLLQDAKANYRFREAHLCGVCRNAIWQRLHEGLYPHLWIY